MRETAALQPPRRSSNCEPVHADNADAVATCLRMEEARIDTPEKERTEDEEKRGEETGQETKNREQRTCTKHTKGKQRQRTPKRKKRDGTSAKDKGQKTELPWQWQR